MSGTIEPGRLSERSGGRWWEDEVGAIPVRADGGRADYPVVVRTGALAELPDLVARAAPAFRYAVISDDRVADLYGEAVAAALVEVAGPAELYTFPAGESGKTRSGWARLTDELLVAGHGRDSCVVSVGGGVTGDLAGFVAATFMRGVPVVQVPTTLVAMIDASVGGKTGVDTAAGKNLVGAFHPPRLVVADPATIRTLSRAERAQGLAEGVKHGAILDRAYLDGLERDSRALLAAVAETLAPAVKRSVELKGDVVSRDEREGGLRQILNFGHTLGHAIEACSAFDVPHGSAVAVGMVLEARLGERLGVTREGTARLLARALDGCELPTRLATLPVKRDVDALLSLTRVDKKGRSGTPRYVLLEGLGAVARNEDGAWSRPVDEAAVRALLEEAFAEG